MVAKPRIMQPIEWFQAPPVFVWSAIVIKNWRVMFALEELVAESA